MLVPEYPRSSRASSKVERDRRQSPKLSLGTFQRSSRRRYRVVRAYRLRALLGQAESHASAKGVELSSRKRRREFIYPAPKSSFLSSTYRSFSSDWLPGAIRNSGRPSSSSSRKKTSPRHGLGSGNPQGWYPAPQRGAPGDRVSTVVPRTAGYARLEFGTPQSGYPEFHRPGGKAGQDSLVLPKDESGGQADSTHSGEHSRGWASPVVISQVLNFSEKCLTRGCKTCTKPDLLLCHRLSFWSILRTGKYFSADGYPGGFSLGLSASSVNGTRDLFGSLISFLL